MEKFDIIVIGAGPAGMTAALNCLRSGNSVLILENENIGGQIALSPRVENFPSYRVASGQEIMEKLYEQIEDWGVRFEYESGMKIEKTSTGFIVKTDYNEYECISVILATGAKARHLNAPREEELIGKGVSYCALCDGSFFTGEDVVVIGDANTALQYALNLSNYCKSVQICTLFDKFFGDKALLDLVLSQKNVSYAHNLALQEYLGKDEIEGVRFENTQTKEEVIYKCKGVFICVGQIPQNEPFKDIVNLDKAGYIIADENCATSTEGIYAAGDCRVKKIRQLVTAASDGSISAFNASQYVASKKL